MHARGAFAVCATFLTLTGACAAPTVRQPELPVRYLARSELKPQGGLGTSKHRLLVTHESGAKDYALVVARGDEVMSALDRFARVERVVAASFTAIGAVREAEVGWFDFDKQKYKAMKLSEQLEMLSLVGDIGVGSEGTPAVHAHATLGRAGGSAFGGHLISALASPTLEVFIRTYPAPLPKRMDPRDDVELFEL